MNKKIKFKCKNCAKVFHQWEGRCDGCNTWNSLEEADRECLSVLRKPQSTSNVLSIKLRNVLTEEISRLSTGIQGFDVVLGGGMTIGSLILLGGEPGVGKSTFLMQVLGFVEKKDTVVYFSGEENASQIKQRADRLKINGENILISNETFWEKLKKYLVGSPPKVLVIDSIQTLQSSEINSLAGNSSQIREITLQLMRLCKNLNITCFIIGHITKDGTIAGPKILEHMVDTVLYLEKLKTEEDDEIKLLKVKKNRFGPTNKIKAFKLNKSGFSEVEEVENKEKLVKSEVIGRASTIITLDNITKIIFVESLVRLNKAGQIKRVCRGFSLNRLNMLIAISEKYMGMDFSNDDIYLCIEEGEKYDLKNIDIAVLASLISSKKEKKLPSKMVFIGSVNLTNEIKSSNLKISLGQLTQWGVTTILTSKSQSELLVKTGPLDEGISLMTVKQAKDILQIM